MFTTKPAVRPINTTYQTNAFLTIVRAMRNATPDSGKTAATRVRRRLFAVFSFTLRWGQVDTGVSGAAPATARKSDRQQTPGRQ